MAKMAVFRLSSAPTLTANYLKSPRSGTTLHPPTHPSIPSGAVARRQTQFRKTVPIVSIGRKLAVAKSVSRIIDVLVDLLIQYVCKVQNHL